MLKNWVLALTLWLMSRRLRLAPGILFWTFVGGYGFIRFWLMYLRVEPRIWMGLTESQIFSGVMAVVGFAAIVRILMTSREAGRAT